MIDVILNILQQAALPSLSFAAGACCTWFFRQRAMENAVKCLLRDRIIQAYNYHIKHGHSIQRDEYRSTLDMGDAYNALDGKNGYIHKIIEVYKEAPLGGKEGEIL